MRSPSLLIFLIACGGRGCGDGCGRDDTGNTGDPCTDEEMSTWFTDLDGDGHGDATSTVEGCEQPDGAVATNDDCDDADGTVWSEGVVYVDGDDDAFGAGDAVDQCGVPDGYAVVDGDCDDDDAAVHPEAAVVCGNGTDDDCDGLSDCADPTEASQADLVLARIAGLGGAFGSAVDIADDIDGDGLADLSVGAPEADGPGAAYLFTGPVGELGSASDAVAEAVGLTDGIFAGNGIGFGDLNGDGVLDWVVAASEGMHIEGGSSIYVLFGPSAGTRILQEGEGVSVMKAASGWSLDGTTDLQGGDVADLLIANGSTVDLLLGPIEEGVEFEDDLAYGGFTATSDGNGVRAIVAGDVTGDGVTDVFIGSPGGEYGDEDDERATAGNAYLIDEIRDFREAGGDEHVKDYARVAILGEYEDSAFGASLSAAGDIDQDGYADVLVGSPAYPIAYAKGAAYLYSGADLTAMDEGDVLFAEESAAQFHGDLDDQQLGYSLAGGADLDGDGTPDVVVGVPGYDGDQGLALVWFGPVRNDQDIEDADLTLTGEAAGDRFGQAMDAGGDFNGYGWDDLVVGAPGASGGDGEVTVFAFDRL